MTPKDPAFDGKTVLIVDDERFARTLMREICTQLGFFRILMAENGQQALETCRATGVDIVLSDLAMPGMDGLQLLEALRAGDGNPNDPDVPVVFLTGAATEAMLRRAMVVGVDRCIAKPPSIDRVRRSLRSALAAR
jgi:CheY-like chemotaxis protein